jgi:hypothetical protein
MEPGTALSVASLGLNVVKDLYKYYELWSGRDEDVASVHHELSWLESLFESIKSTLNNDDLDQTIKKSICNSIEVCQEIVPKLKKRLGKAKKEVAPDTLLGKVERPKATSLVPIPEGDDRPHSGIDCEMQGADSHWDFFAQPVSIFL